MNNSSKVYVDSNFWLIFDKLCEARSRLYRSRSLEVKNNYLVNTRLNMKALEEIYKILDLQTSAPLRVENLDTIRQYFSHVCK